MNPFELDWNIYIRRMDRGVGWLVGADGYEERWCLTKCGAIREAKKWRDEATAQVNPSPKQYLYKVKRNK